MELLSGHLSRKQVRGYIEKLVEEQMLKQDGDGKMRSAIFGFAEQPPVELRSLICAAGWRFCRLRCPYPDKITVLQYYFRQPGMTKHDNPAHNALLVRYMR